jgi:hypothetical protein
MTLESAAPLVFDRQTIYTCPMHPQVTQDQPGDCPLCGMELEAGGVTTAEHAAADAELQDMSKRLCVSLVLGVPVVLLAMLPMLGVPRVAERDHMATEYVYPDRAGDRGSVCLQWLCPALSPADSGRLLGAWGSSGLL